MQLVTTPCWRLLTPWGEEIEFSTADALRKYLADESAPAVSRSPDLEVEGAASAQRDRLRDVGTRDVPSDIPTKPALMAPMPEPHWVRVPSAFSSSSSSSSRPRLLMAFGGGTERDPAEKPPPASPTVPILPAEPSREPWSDSSSDPCACLGPPSSWSSPVSVGLRLSLLPPPVIVGPARDEATQDDVEEAALPHAAQKPLPSDRAGWVAIGAVLGAGFVTFVSRGGVERARTPEATMAARAPSGALPVATAPTAAPSSSPATPPPVADTSDASVAALAADASVAALAADASVAVDTALAIELPMNDAPAPALARTPTGVVAATSPRSKPSTPRVATAAPPPHPEPVAKARPLVATAASQPRAPASDLAFRVYPTTNAKSVSPDLLKQAASAREKNDRPRARALYKAALAQTPDNATALTALGDLARADGKNGDARTYYEHALAVTSSTSVLLRLADTLWDLDDKAGARRRYAEVLHRGPASSYPERVLDRAMPQ